MFSKVRWSPDQKLSLRPSGQGLSRLLADPPASLELDLLVSSLVVTGAAGLSFPFPFPVVAGAPGLPPPLFFLGSFSPCAYLHLSPKSHVPVFWKLKQTPAAAVMSALVLGDGVLIVFQCLKDGGRLSTRLRRRGWCDFLQKEDPVLYLHRLVII